MNARALESLGWEQKVAALTAEMKNQVGRSRWLHDHFRDELRTYGLCLAHARTSIELADGIENPARKLASDEWWGAMQSLTKAYDLPDDGSTYGSVSQWFPADPQTRADKIELANRAVDVALLKYCAK